LIHFIWVGEGEGRGSDAKKETERGLEGKNRRQI